MAYRSVLRRAETEYVVEKSRFIGYCAHTAGEAAARAFLNEVRALHPLATHVCFGFVADKTGNEQRFSDDGEPQGTAGMPILNVVKGNKLFETAVAVVRYFGGVKLGTGGLVRAYTKAAQDAVAAAGVCEYDLCAEIQISVGYAETDALLRFLGGKGIGVLSRMFGERAVFTVAVREGEREAFASAVQDVLCGRAEIESLTAYYAPVNENQQK